MAVYLKDFANHSDYVTYIESTSFLPNVSFCENEDHVHYNPEQGGTTPPNTEIWYTTQSGTAVDLTQWANLLGDGYTGPAIVSNTYSGGKGVIKFASDVEKIGVWSDGPGIKYCCPLFCVSSYVSHDITSITLPDCIVDIKSIYMAQYDGWFSEFYNNTSLTAAHLSTAITSIETNLFCGCSALETVNIPENVTSISQSAFLDCGSLNNVVVPSYVMSIGNSAFQNCSSMNKITFLADSPASIGSNVFSGCANDLEIFVPAQSVDFYKDMWMEYDSKIKPIQN